MRQEGMEMKGRKRNGAKMME